MGDRSAMCKFVEGEKVCLRAALWEEATTEGTASQLMRIRRFAGRDGHAPGLGDSRAGVVVSVRHPIGPGETEYLVKHRPLVSPNGRPFTQWWYASDLVPALPNPELLAPSGAAWKDDTTYAVARMIAAGMIA